LLRLSAAMAKAKTPFTSIETPLKTRHPQDPEAPSNGQDARATVMVTETTPMD
jgi:hypothetical protein